MYHFFAMLSRMKYINRWGLMRNTRHENLSEHSLETAIVAHALAVIGNTKFGRKANPERAAALALLHDAGEIITGDLPTPVKYYSPDIRAAYGEVESMAVERLVSMLPLELRPAYRELMTLSAPGDQELLPLVKAADRISAVIKCMEERLSGNQDFREAEESTWRALKEMNLPEAEYFMREFLPSYGLTLDEQNQRPAGSGGKESAQ
ncbi:MAG: 5'-deoxynucleotidase [Acutalibacter sp.]|nr:5'-deoxynucleotidase [Acutalibacter sp.]